MNISRSPGDRSVAARLSAARVCRPPAGPSSRATPARREVFVRAILHARAGPVRLLCWVATPSACSSWRPNAQCGARVGDDPDAFHQPLELRPRLTHATFQGVPWLRSTGAMVRNTSGPPGGASSARLRVIPSLPTPLSCSAFREGGLARRADPGAALRYGARRRLWPWWRLLDHVMDSLGEEAPRRAGLGCDERRRRAARRRVVIQRRSASHKEAPVRVGKRSATPCWDRRGCGARRVWAGPTRSKHDELEHRQTGCSRRTGPSSAAACSHGV